MAAVSMSLFLAFKLLPDNIHNQHATYDAVMGAIHSDVIKLTHCLAIISRHWQRSRVDLDSLCCQSGF